MQQPELRRAADRKAQQQDEEKAELLRRSSDSTGRGMAEQSRPRRAAEHKLMNEGGRTEIELRRKSSGSKEAGRRRPNRAEASSRLKRVAEHELLNGGGRTEVEPRRKRGDSKEAGLSRPNRTEEQ